MTPHSKSQRNVRLKLLQSLGEPDLRVLACAALFTGSRFNRPDVIAHIADNWPHTEAQHTFTTLLEKAR
jgi:hypothetical protein